MCRYAFHYYRDHFACFRCRKAFKYWQWGKVHEEHYFSPKRRLERRPREITCPDCHEPMADMGLDFRSPQKNDRKMWRMLEVLHQNGHTFHSCGCHTNLTPPHTLRELPDWLERHRRSSIGESLLTRFAARPIQRRRSL